MLSSKKTRITPGALCGSFCFLLFWWPRAERRHIGGSLTLRGALRKNAGGAGTVPPGVLQICLPAGPALAALTANVEAALSRTGEAAAHPASTAAETPGRGGEGAEARGGGQGPGVFFLLRKRAILSSYVRSRSPSGSPHRKSSSADRGNPSRRGDVTPGAPPSPRRSRGRSSSTVTPLSNAERVAKRMLKNSGVLRRKKKASRRCHSSAKPEPVLWSLQPSRFCPGRRMCRPQSEL